MATPSVSESTIAQFAGVSSVSLTVTAAAGALLVAGYVDLNGNRPFSVNDGTNGANKDSQNNTWTPLTANQEPNSAYWMQIFYAKNVTSGSTTVRLTQNSGLSAQGNMVLFEVANASTTAPFDAESLCDNSSATTHYAAASGAIDTAADVFVLVVGNMNVDRGAPTAKSGWTRLTGAGVLDNYFMFQYRTSASALTDERGEWTQPTGSNGAAVIASFKADAGGGTTDKTSSDTIALSISEAATLTAALAGADTTTLSVADGAALVSGLAGADAIALSVSDAPALAAAVSGADAVGLATSESAALAAALAGADTVTLSTSESGSVVEIDAKASSDGVALALSESAALVADLVGADSLQLVVSHGHTLDAALSSVDGLALSIAEATTIAAALAAADVVAIAISESGDVTVIDAKVSSDTLAVALTEAGAIEAALAGGDAVSVTLADVPALVALLAGSDALALALGHGSVIIIDGVSYTVLRITAETLRHAHVTGDAISHAHVTGDAISHAHVTGETLT